MKRVVYFLGAGFSAPLGIPVMANFLEKARDQFENEGDKFKHFGPFLASLDKTHVARTYYTTDVFNIEDILSILDMKGLLDSESEGEDFRRLISDVVEHNTPPMKKDPSAHQWSSLLFWDRPWTEYGPFVTALLGYEFVKESLDEVHPTRDAYRCRETQSNDVSYSVVTLNYDLVLETVATALKKAYHVNRSFALSAEERGTPLVKLHGSIGSPELVPPLWSKTLDVPGLRQAWRRAYHLLKAAHDIRIIGYSLPETDAYVRYLLRAAATETPNLKRIHVLCRDDREKSVQKRYDAFVKFPGYRFVAGDTETYLRRFHSLSQWPDRIGPENLEQVHRGEFGPS